MKWLEIGSGFAVKIERGRGVRVWLTGGTETARLDSETLTMLGALFSHLAAQAAPPICPRCSTEYEGETCGCRTVPEVSG